MLDRLYERFDELSYALKVFKVETIGGQCFCARPCGTAACPLP
jgi:hypothetical protein